MIVDFSNRELFNYKYIPLLRDKNRYIFLMWWWWSWKSKFTAQKEIIKSFEKWNRLLWVRKVKDTIKDSVFAELEWVIDDWKLNDYFQITKSPLYIKNKLSWSDVIFRWLDDVEKIKSVKWVTRVWLEEATEADEWDFDQLDIRLRWIWKELQITCTYNPISDQHWLITQYWNKKDLPDMTLCHSTYKDNRFVWHEHYDKVMLRLKWSNMNLYKIYALWIPWKAVEWLIYEYENIDKIPEQARLMWYWLDFWFNHPMALLWIYEYNIEDKKSWEIIKWIILDEVLYWSWYITSDIIKFLDDEKFSKSEEIIGDNSRPEAIEEMFQSWYNCKPCIKWPWSVKDWIETVQTYKIYITARSAKSKKDFDNYVWAKDKDWNYLEVPVKAFDDAPDAARYWIATFFKKQSDYIFE